MRTTALRRDAIAGRWRMKPAAAMTEAALADASLVEPARLIEHFLAHPPLGFEAQVLPGGVPAFVAPFDLLTTADDDLRRRVQRLPGHAWWRRLLRWRTCFVGTTVSEYTVLPADLDVPAFVDALLSGPARRHALTIVKDLPQESPLLAPSHNDVARRLSEALVARGCVMLEGQALAWLPLEFADADGWLQSLSAGRRKDLRRKLRARAELDIRGIATGSAYFDDETVVDAYYALYDAVYAQSEIHFDRLSRAFFAAVLRDAASQGLVFEYRHGEELLGFNLCYVVNDALVDKYIGLRYPQAREFNLYFVSWAHNLDEACRRGLRRYIAGWTDPTIKAYLGARFTLTRHAVYLRNPLLRALLRRIGSLFESDSQWQEDAGATGRTRS